MASNQSTDAKIAMQDVESNKKDLYIQKLENDLLRQAEEYSHAERLQKALFSISELASGAEDFSHFCQSLHQNISGLLNSENFYIGLLDENQEALELVYFVDSVDKETGTDDKPYSIPLSTKSLSTYLYRLEKSALLCADDILTLQNNGLVQRLGPPARSWLGAPLISEGMVLGIIVVQSYSDDFIYQTWHQELFEYISNVIATTLERKQNRLQLELKVKNRTQKLQQEVDLRKQREEIEAALLKIADLANSTVELKEFYHTLHQIISKLIYADNFYIALLSENDESIEFVYYADTLDDITVESLAKEPREVVENSLTAYLLENKKSILVSNTDIEQLEANGQIKLQGSNPLSWLGVTLEMDDKTLGVIALQSYIEEEIFSQQELLTLKYISKPVATAIQRKTSRQKLENLVKQRTKEIDQINQKLVEKIVEKTQAERLQSALYEIAKLASGIEDMPTFYESIHKILGSLFYAENFYIALIDESNENLDFKYFVDLKDKRPFLGQRYSINNKSLSSLLFRSDKPILLQRDNFDEFMENNNVDSLGSPFTSWLGVPLREDGRSIGIMVVQSYLDSVVYESWHLELLEYVSHQVALTLSRKKDRENLEMIVFERTLKLEEEIEQRKKSQDTQSALYFIANLANMDLELEDFYKELHNIIGRLVYSENFFIGLKNDDGSMSIVYYEDTMDDYNLESISAIPEENLRNSLTYYVMNSERSLLATTNEISELTRKEGIDVFGEETVSWLGIPLEINNTIIGIMVLQSYREDKILTAQDRELMIFVGQHVATALQRNKNRDLLKIQVSQRTTELNQSNKKLKKQIEETEKSKQLQIALYKIADLASSTEKMSYLYNQFHEIISKLIYAKNFYIALYDDNREKLDFVYFVDTQDVLSKDSVKQIPASQIKHTFTGYVLKTGESFLKLKDDKLKHKEMGIKTVGKEACYWLGVPLKINKDIIGIIVVQSYDEAIQLDNWHQELLEFVSHHIAITLERKQAHKALEKRVEERTLELAKINNSLQQQVKERRRSESIQAALYKIANLSNENIQQKILFKKIHQIIESLLFSENFYIALWDEDKDDMNWVYFVDSENNFDQSLLSELSEDDKKQSFARYIVKTAEPILADKQGILEMAESGKVSVIGPLTEYFLGVPLIGTESTIGAMAIQSYDINRKYTLADQELLNFVAQSIVSTIEKREQNIQLEERVERRTQEINISNELLQKEIAQRKESEDLQTALFEISETPQQCVTEGELYTRLHEIISRLMYVESFYIALVDNENRSFNFDYIYDHVDKNVPHSIPIGNTLTSYVYRKGKTVHIDYEKIRALEDSGEIDHLGSYSTDWIGVPLISAGSIYGIMILQSYDERYIYTNREVDILNFVSTHIAEALQRKNTEKRLRNTYAELATKTKKAEAASEAKSSFLATVSHEIRTPMNGILGLLSLMSDTSMSRRQRDYVSKISASANSLLGIINDILDFSKIEQGKLELEHLEFNLLEILDNLIDLFSSRINEKDLDFTIDIEPNVQLARLGDSLRLSQVLINLVGNAIKFTEKGHVRILVKEIKKDTLSFFVEDSGIGIAPEQHSKIFGTFTQADDTTTRKFGGSGLGLSICQQLVSMMEGKIEVKGKLGVGSCFSFDASIPARENKDNYNLDLSGTKLLLISDHPLQIESWQNFCQRFDLPLTAMTSQAILDYQPEENSIPRALSHIFIDESVENHHGLDVLESVRNLINFKTPCFLLANPSPHMSELPNLGDDVQFIPKPNKMGVILSLIQDDYDVLQITNTDPSQKTHIRPKLLGSEILVAEDNLINQQVAKEILQKAGAKITLVENGQLAVEACRKSSFDLVLMDMQMPIMDGYQASQTIREFCTMEQLPIIAMTANVMKGDREKCLRYGMNDYIGKPIDRNKLFKTIETFFTNSKVETEQHTVNQKDKEVPVMKEEEVQNQIAAKEQSSSFEIEALADKFDSMELAQELVKMFYQGHKNDLDTIESALQNKDYLDARAIVHKLKGSAGELDIIGLHKQSETIESQLKLNAEPNQQDIKDFYACLKSILEQFQTLTED